MRFGYWLPVFGGWLRSVEDEGMEASWAYVRRLAQRSEALGYDVTLIAELSYNDIKGEHAPTLEAWTTAAALAAVTHRLEILVAVRPTFHPPGPFAKQAANLALLSGGRLSLNVVSAWWATEARRLGVPFDEHDDRYARTDEWLDLVTRLWAGERVTAAGRFYHLEDAFVVPTPPRIPLYAGGESPAAKALIARRADVYLMHGDPPERLAPKIADMRARREAAGFPPLGFGVAAFVVCRPTAEAAQRELRRIVDVRANPRAFASYQDFVRHSRLETPLPLEDYVVSNRGLRTGLVGTPEQIAERIAALERIGVDLLLLQCSPQLEEMERIAAEVFPLVGGSPRPDANAEEAHAVAGGRARAGRDAGGP